MIASTICMRQNGTFDNHAHIPVVSPQRSSSVRSNISTIILMSDSIDTEHTDMRQLAFDVIQGIDLPDWKDVKSVDEIEISRVSGAMTNIIFKVVIKNKDCQSLLLRAYGNCTDLFLDREAEVKNFKLLSDNNFGITLIKTFPGGRLELWRDGYDAITAPEMRSPEMSVKIAKKLAEMHRIHLGDGDKMVYFKHYYSWIDAIKKNPMKGHMKEVRVDLLKDEVDDFVRRITAEDYEVVFGHHDLQHGNILKNDKGEIIFVDFEYSGEISVGSDIANHFCEWMTDYNLPDSHLLRREWHPTVEQQKLFVSTYLRERLGREPTEEEVEKLRITVLKHEMMSHMHWFLWGLLQYQLSDIDWDYWGYAVCRWNYYKEMKKQFFNADVLPIMP